MNSHQRRRARRAYTKALRGLTSTMTKVLIKNSSPERYQELVDIWKEFTQITDDPKTTSRWRVIGTPTMPKTAEPQQSSER